MGFWSRLFGYDSNSSGDDDGTWVDEPLELDALTEEERVERRRALLKRIRKLEIVTRRIVNQQMAGSY
ncbi:MAG: hypothetical protein AAFS10_18450, partial [Myxococcota bacterium]